ncbi:hypothetical protein [Mariniluteicoccus flavus]
MRTTHIPLSRAGVGALVAASFALTACSGAGAPSVPAPPAPSAPAPAPATSAPASSAPATSAPASSAPATTSGGGSAAGSQTTPEAVAETFLHALGNGDGKGACAVMAANNQPISSIPEAKGLCETSFGQVAQSAAKSSPDLKDAKVTGATVSGDSAEFKSAKVTSSMGQGLLGSMKAVKIKGAWYITS